MMTSDSDIQMFVADVLQDDEIENIDSILRMLNHEDESSWRVARGALLTTEEVRAALKALMDAGLVTPCSEQPPAYECRPISKELVGAAIPWDAVWFHLEPTGRDAVTRWWVDEAKGKYPLKGGST